MFLLQKQIFCQDFLGLIKNVRTSGFSNLRQNMESFSFTNVSKLHKNDKVAFIGYALAGWTFFGVQFKFNGSFSGYKNLVSFTPKHH